ncbi:3-hydroxybutyryl-CoA dehydrogenase [Celeribacter sp.]|uniref:3-hydroxybutyryl-CoA dehydrogenase n=1 Tax=Celeribacter sp. TaxID=1890673 RepID=UPI003A8ED4F4
MNANFDIKRVAVIGAGQMGIGIAQVCAQAGITVLLNDISRDALHSGFDKMKANLERLCAREKATHQDVSATLARISLVDAFSGLGSADLVIEAATESETVKAQIFSSLMRHLRPETIVATNTSSISITRLATISQRPEHFLGVHFMNPVPQMNLVEIIRGIATNAATFEIVQNFVGRIGKTATVSEDYPAFVVNRILIPMINEAVFTLYEGVGSIASIDASMKLGANHPMGPLELADFIGLDTCLAIMTVLNNGLNDPKYRPCPLLMKYVDAGWLGRKSGRGFYDYRQTPPMPTR